MLITLTELTIILVDLRDANNKEITNDYEKAELINSYFINTIYRRHTNPHGRYGQNEIKRNKRLNYFIPFYFILVISAVGISVPSIF